MLPASHSVQNLQSGGLTLQPPPRSRSNVNLASSAAPQAGLNHSGNYSNNAGITAVHSGSYASPSFLRSASSGANHTSPAPQQHAFVRSTSDMPPSPSLKSRTAHASHPPAPPQRSASGSHTPTQPTFAHNAPPLHHSASASHFGIYDSRLVANTINKIEASSTAGTLVSATSGANSSSAGAAPPGSSHGPENDAWTAVCIRTLPLL